MAKSAAAKAAAKAAKEAKIASIIIHFDTTYSAKHDRLAAFQQLCGDLEVDIGTSLTQCKQVISIPSVAT
jgi:hypothetical protein